MLLEVAPGLQLQALGDVGCCWKKRPLASSERTSLRWETWLFSSCSALFAFFFAKICRKSAHLFFIISSSFGQKESDREAGAAPRTSQEPREERDRGGKQPRLVHAC